MGWLFWLIIGMFIGWNFPQPWYAKAAQKAAVAWWKRLTNRTEKTGE